MFPSSTSESILNFGVFTSLSPLFVTNDFIRSTSPRGIFLVYLSATFLFPTTNTVEFIYNTRINVYKWIVS
jgi:hypothetical protein